ncbi:MAG TPA: hypothetical protein PKE00_07615, partial [Planctomycetota bacterium]|nr:hypothetical protein [Planctomycetota bacterium]
APVRALPIPLPASATPLPASATPLPAAAPPAPEQAPADIVDENTDFRAGTRWPWITALVFLVISFVVTLVVLKAF